MVGKVLGGTLNLVGGLLGGPQHQDNSGPGRSGSAPGHGGTLPPGHGGTPPGHSHASADLKPILDQGQFQQAPPPKVDLQPGATGERPAPAGPPEVTGRKGPAGNDPWVSQMHPTGETTTDYQNGDQNCAPAVATMVARNIGFGKDKTDAELIMELGQVGGTTSQGTSGNGLIAMYEHMGLDTNAAPGADLTWVQQELQAGHHVNVLGDYYEVPGRVETDKTAGHYLDVTGITKEGNFLVNDPMDPSVTQLTAAQLQNFIASAPNGGFAVSAWKPTGGG